jgi:hypothetical protein
MATIVAFDQVQAWLGVNEDDQKEVDIAALVHQLAEGAVQAHLGYNVVQAPYVEFHPDGDLAEVVLDPFADFGATAFTPDVPATNEPSLGVILLKNMPVKAVTEVRVSTTGYGQATNFPPASVLDPTSYRVRGRRELVSNAGTWPVTGGSVMVTYTAGYTAQELLGVASPIRQAVLDTAKFRWQNRPGRGQAGGILVSEGWPDYRATYAHAGAVSADSVSLPASAIRALEPFRKLP